MVVHAYDSTAQLTKWEDCGFHASLDYIVRHGLKKKKTQKHSILNTY